MTVLQSLPQAPRTANAAPLRAYATDDRAPQVEVGRVIPLRRRGAFVYSGPFDPTPGGGASERAGGGVMGTPFERAAIGSLILIANAVEAVAEAIGVRVGATTAAEQVNAAVRNAAPFLDETPDEPASEVAVIVDLDALERLAREATPGVWWIDDKSPVDIRGGHPEGAEASWFVAHAYPEGSNDSDLTSRRDARFIAAANPAAILGLIARIRAAEGLA